MVRAKTNRNCLLSGLWLPMRLIIKMIQDVDAQRLFPPDASVTNPRSCRSRASSAGALLSLGCTLPWPCAGASFWSIVDPQLSVVNHDNSPKSKDFLQIISLNPFVCLVIRLFDLHNSLETPSLNLLGVDF